jgi:U3 small nucleolar RNA-associated protein 22
MPNSIFQEKDFMNLRYCFKRAYYLSVIAEALKPLDLDMQYLAFQNDTRRPILILTSKSNHSKKHFSKHGTVIRIFPIISSSLFPPLKLSPLRNNIRPTNGELLTPTPHYNNIILQDTSMITHLNLLNEVIGQSKEFQKACMLVKIWLYQRGLSTTKYGYGITGFIISMIISSLIRSKKLFNLNEYQMIKYTFTFLSEFDFKKNVLFLTDDFKSVNDTFSNDAFLKAFDVCVVCPSGTTNLTHHVSTSAMNELQYECKIALQLLNSDDNNCFEILFLKKVDVPLLKFDNVFR